MTYLLQEEIKQKQAELVFKISTFNKLKETEKIFQGSPYHGMAVADTRYKLLEEEASLCRKRLCNLINLAQL